MRRSWTVVPALVAALSLAASNAAAQLPADGVKAAFIRNFISFVTWPPERLASGAPLVVCAFNGSGVAAALSALTIADVRDHRVQIRNVNTVPDLDTCHAVFVPASEARGIADIRAQNTQGGLLIITEDDSRGRKGGALNLFVTDNRVAFDADLAAAQAQGLIVSSKLLSLARHVHLVSDTTTLSPQHQGGHK